MKSFLCIFSCSVRESFDAALGLPRVRGPEETVIKAFTAVEGHKGQAYIKTHLLPLQILIPTANSTLQKLHSLYLSK